MAIQLEIGLDIIRSYKRLSYTPWHALAEFVDNSTQAFFNNREELDKAFSESDEKLEVSIVYDRDADLIRISDNSMGMSESELRYALRVGAKPANTAGRSKYGMGLKTAACWLGNRWTVRTKKLGEELEHSVTVDVEKVAEGANALPTESKRAANRQSHYTVVEITDLNQKFHGPTLGKIRRFLESMYRIDLRKGDLILLWQGVPLQWTVSEDRFVKAADGSIYKKDIYFEVSGKPVSGWIGVLDYGHSGRPNAGFSILHSNRVVKGFPESWRPQSIFGQIDGSNDLINQRITGEIHLDAFEVSHTKDDILWFGDEETQVQEKLKEAAAPYVAVAKDRRRPDMQGKGGPTELEIKTALNELQEELTSSEMADLITIETAPPPEVVQHTLKPVLNSVETRTPHFAAQVSHLRVDGFLVADGSPNDPYVAVDSTSSHRVVVVVNMLHPYVTELTGSEGMLDYLRQSTFDAIAEWQARHMTSKLDPDTIKILKDRLLRIPPQIVMQEDSAQDEAS